MSCLSLSHATSELLTDDWVEVGRSVMGSNNHVITESYSIPNPLNGGQQIGGYRTRQLTPTKDRSWWTNGAVGETMIWWFLPPLYRACEFGLTVGAAGLLSKKCWLTDSGGPEGCYDTVNWGSPMSVSLAAAVMTAADAVVGLFASYQRLSNERPDDCEIVQGTIKTIAQVATPALMFTAYALLNRNASRGNCPPTDDDVFPRPSGVDACILFTRDVLSSCKGIIGTSAFLSFYGFLRTCVSCCR